jgi:membrane protein implicated in regulation of membrane protease activity
MAALLTILMFAAPAAAFWLLVGGLDPIGRLVVAGLASLVLVAGVGWVMLTAALWSPRWGFVVVLAVSALVAPLRYLQNRRAARKRRSTAETRAEGLPLPASPAAPTQRRQEAEDDEGWLYES